MYCLCQGLFANGSPRAPASFRFSTFLRNCHWAPVWGQALAYGSLPPDRCSVHVWWLGRKRAKETGTWYKACAVNWTPGGLLRGWNRKMSKAGILCEEFKFKRVERRGLGEDASWWWKGVSKCLQCWKPLWTSALLQLTVLPGRLAEHGCSVSRHWEERAWIDSSWCSLYRVR